jgi:hypothetical protein
LDVYNLPRKLPQNLLNENLIFFSILACSKSSKDHRTLSIYGLK